MPRVLSLWSRSSRCGNVNPMRTLPRVIAVEAIENYVLRLTFSDGLVRELDFAPTVRAGVFTSIADPSMFEAVFVDDQTGTICWPNGVDLDPDVLHGGAESTASFAPRSVREYQLRSSA